MKRFLATVILLLCLAITAFSQTQGTAMRSTNGAAYGVTRIAGSLIATATVANGGSNYIAGTLQLGISNASINAETLKINNVVTNPSVSVRETLSSLKVSHTAENSDKIHSGFMTVSQVGAANTADWTNEDYPQLIGFNSTLQSESGSSGRIRRVAGYGATLAGPFPAGTGAWFDEAVGIWIDTSNNGLNYFAGVKITGLEQGTNNTGVYLGIEQESYPLPGNWAFCDTTAYPSYLAGHVSIGSTNASSVTNVFSIVGGTLTTLSKAVSITATLPSSASSERGLDLSITSAGSGANVNIASKISLLAGYTGSSFSEGQDVNNSSAGAGASIWTGGGGNYGTLSKATGATAGNNVGVFGQVQGSSTLNLGVFGRAVSASGSATTNVGAAGHALNASTANVGGFFGLMASAPATLVSSALIADNGAVAAPSFIARDNGTEVFRIDDGGVVYGNAAGMSNAVDLIAGNYITITTNGPRTFTLSSSAQTNYILDLQGNGTNTVLWNNNISRRAFSTTNGLILGDFDDAVSYTFSPFQGGRIGGDYRTTSNASIIASSSTVMGDFSTSTNVTVSTFLASHASGLAQASRDILIRANNASWTGLSANSASNIIVAGDSAALTGLYVNSGQNLFLSNTVGVVALEMSASDASGANIKIITDHSVLVGYPPSNFTNTYQYTVAVIDTNGAVNGFSTNGFFGLSASLTNGVLWQGGAQLTNIYTATATLDFGNVATIGCADLTMTVTGAALGDVVDLGVPNASVVANSSYSAWVSAADTVTVRFCALISGDPASGVFRAEVHKWKQ